MSRELRTIYQGLASLYCIIRRISDGYVWNGTTFVAWSDGDIHTYAVSMTCRGGDIYDADFPSAIPAGDYWIVVYVKTEEAPSPSDAIVTSFEKYWNGYVAVSSSTITISPYALASLDYVKTYLGITGSAYDTVLTMLINQVTAFVERVCGRGFKARDYVSRFNGRFQRAIVLPNFPVLSVRRVTYGSADAMTCRYTGGLAASISVSTTALELVYWESDGTKNTASLLFTDYPTTALLVDAVNNLTGWYAELKSNQPSAMLNTMGGTDVLNLTATITYPDLADALYEVDYERGVIEFSREWWQAWSATSGVWGFWGGSAWGEPRGAVMRDYQRRFPRVMAGILVDYRAGYETVPDDVQMVAMELVSERYNLRKRDPAVKSATLGPYSVVLSQRDSDYVRSRLACYLSSESFVSSN